jgi:hypothetical protein
VSPQARVPAEDANQVAVPVVPNDAPQAPVPVLQSAHAFQQILPFGLRASFGISAAAALVFLKSMARFLI